MRLRKAFLLKSKLLNNLRWVSFYRHPPIFLMSNDYNLGPKLDEYFKILTFLEEAAAKNDESDLVKAAKEKIKVLDKELDVVLNKLADRYDKTPPSTTE